MNLKTKARTAFIAMCVAGIAEAGINVRTDLVPLGIAPSNAAGDGVTDDAPALKAVAEYVRTRGGTVVFPAGRYRLDSQVRFAQDSGKDLELVGDGAVFFGGASALLAVGSRTLADKTLTRPSGAFDTVLHVPDVEGLAVGDLVGVHSRRSSEWPTEQNDNSSGVEHLAHLAAIDADALTVTLSVPLPWHQKASNNIFKHLRKHGYFRFAMRGFAFEIATGSQTAMDFVCMKDVTLKNMTCAYVGPEPVHPQGWGFRFNMVHGLYAENVDFRRVMYCLTPMGGCSDHTYVGCDGYRVRHTFVLSDITHTVIRDSSGYDCVAHLDTHRGVKDLTIIGCRSVGDQGGFRNVAVDCTMRDSVFSGFHDAAVQVGAEEPRTQAETYVVRVEGRGLDRIAIDDVLTLGQGMSAAVVSLVEKEETAATLIAYQTLGRGAGKRDLGSVLSGRGGWSFTVDGKEGVAGRVTFVEYVQAHYGRHVIENCVFDGANSAKAAIEVDASFPVELRNVTIVRPFVGVSAVRSAAIWNDGIVLKNVRVVEPRQVGFRVGGYTGIRFTDCEVVGVRRQAVGLECREGEWQTVRLEDCRFRGLRTAVNIKTRLRPLPAGSWMVIGPFPGIETGWTIRKFMQTPYAPEKTIDLQAEVPSGNDKALRWVRGDSREGLAALGDKAPGTQWTFAELAPESGVNFLPPLGVVNRGLCYAVTFIDAAEARPVEFAVGCDWWARAWLNGEELVSTRRPESVTSDGAAFNMGAPISAYGQLRKGRSTLLVKCLGGLGSTSFAAAFSDPDYPLADRRAQGELHATGLAIENCDTGLVLSANAQVRVAGLRNLADVPVVRRAPGSETVRAVPRYEPGPSREAAEPGEAFFDLEKRRFRFRTADGWRNEDGSSLKAGREDKQP